MALYLNRSTGRDSSGRNTYSGRERVGFRARSSGGGYERVAGGEISTERGSLIKDRVNQENQAAIAAQEQAAATRTESTAIASTVGSDGRPSVIRQTSFIGGFSAPVNGQAGFGTASYSRNDVVGVSGTRAPVNNAGRSQINPLSQRPFVRATQYDTTPTQRFGRAVSAGFREGSAVRVTTGTQPETTQRQFDNFSRTERFGFQAAKAGRYFGEPLAFATGAGAAIRGAGAATAAARATAFGRAPIARSILGTGITGAVARGGIGIGATAFAGRSIERARVNRVGRETNIQGLNLAVDRASQRYSEGSGRFRRFAETGFGSFIDQPRFTREVETELIGQGVNPSRARFAAQRVTSNRVVGRAYTDIGVGVQGEVVGETTGRLAQARLFRYASGRFPNVTERARTIGSRTAGSFFGGALEGGAQGGAGGFQNTGRVSGRDVAFGGAFGAASAGFAGGSLAFLGTSTRRGARRLGTAYEAGLDVVDPLERPGDAATDAFFRGYAARSGYGGGRTRTFGSGFAPSSPASSRQSARSNEVSSFSSGFAPTSSRSIVPSRTELRGLVPSRTIGNPTISNTLTITPSRNIVPTRISFPTQVPSRTTVPTRVPTRTNVPTRVATPPFALPFIPGFGGGTGGREGKGSKGGKRREDIYASSLTAGVLNLRASKGSKRSGGFLGIEVRGI